MSSTILLLRHGETEANSKGVLQGQSESDLTAKGRQQATELAASIRARLPALAMPLCSTVYTSDLRRTRDTAQAVVDALQNVLLPSPPSLHPDARLRERRLGPFQGKSVADCARYHPRLWTAFNSGDDAAVKACVESGAGDNGGVEVNDEMSARAAEALSEIAAAHPGQSVLVVSHGGFVHMAICAMSGIGAEEVWRVRFKRETPLGNDGTLASRPTHLKSLDTRYPSEYLDTLDSVCTEPLTLVLTRAPSHGSVPRPLHPLHPAPCTSHAPVILHPPPRIPHPAPCTLHPSPCTLHPAPVTPTLHTLRCRTLEIAPSRHSSPRIDTPQEAPRPTGASWALARPATASRRAAESTWTWRLRPCQRAAGSRGDRNTVRSRQHLGCTAICK